FSDFAHSILQFPGRPDINQETAYAAADSLPEAPMQFQFDVTTAQQPKPVSAPSGPEAVPELLRQILDLQRDGFTQMLEVQREHLTHARQVHQEHLQRWKNVMSRWVKEFPDLAGECKNVYPDL